MSVSPASHASRGSVSPRSSASTPTHGAGAPSALLPDPQILDNADAIALLTLLESKDQTLSVREGGAEINSLQTKKKEAVQKELDAIAKEKDAQSHRSFWDDLGDFFSDVAKVAAVVASFAAVVVTAGAAAPVAAIAIGGILLSAASMADGEFHFLKKLGVDAQTAGFIDLGLGLAGTAATFGAGLAGGGQAAKDGLVVLQRAATGTSGVATVAHGATGVAAAGAQSDHDQAAADQTSDISQSQRMLRLEQLVLDELQQWESESSQVLTTLANTNSTINQTSNDAAVGVRG